MQAASAALIERSASAAATEVAAGGAAGVAAWALVYPVDVIKARLQAAPGTATWGSVCGEMWREGPRAFVRGMAPTLLRAFCVNAAIFYGVGASKRALGAA